MEKTSKWIDLDNQALNKNPYPQNYQARESLPLNKKITHCILITIGWFVYFVFLSKFITHPSELLQMLLSLMGLFVIIVFSVTCWWIFHNIQIFKRKGPRVKLPEIMANYTKDWDGRIINADWDQLKSAKNIVITVNEKEKQYSIGDI